MFPIQVVLVILFIQVSQLKCSPIPSGIAADKGSNPSGKAKSVGLLDVLQTILNTAKTRQKRNYGYYQPSCGCQQSQPSYGCQQSQPGYCTVQPAPGTYQVQPQMVSARVQPSAVNFQVQPSTVNCAMRTRMTVNAYNTGQAQTSAYVDGQARSWALPSNQQPSCFMAPQNCQSCYGQQPCYSQQSCGCYSRFRFRRHALAALQRQLADMKNI